MTNTRKTTSAESVDLLICLQSQAKANHSSELGVIASRLSWGVGRVVRVLDHLDKKGLVDRENIGLTMRGLAIALSLAADQPANRRPRLHAISA